MTMALARWRRRNGDDNEVDGDGATGDNDGDNATDDYNNRR
jgi:hypothetical protein